MGELQIVEPMAGRNLIFNPSAEVDLTNYTAISGVMLRSLFRARFGRASVEMSTNGILAAEGILYSHFETGTNVPITFSAYVRGPEGGEVRLRMVDPGNGNEWRTDPVQLRDDFWQRLVVTGFLGPVVPGTMELYVETPDDPQAITFYTDGLQMEREGFVTTYIDGDLELAIGPHKGQPFFEWDGALHNSQSTRSDQYRRGGRFRDVSQGLDTDLWFTAASGLGMPPLNVLVSEFVDQEIANYQRSVPLPRTLLITFWATITNQEKRMREGTANLEGLHRAREALEAFVKPDRVREAQEFMLRYLNQNGNGRSPAAMDLLAIYESGLEWDGDLRFPFNNSFGVRLLCPDPFWRVDSQDVCQLEAQDDAEVSSLMARINGEWRGFDCDGDFARVIEVHPITGEIYVGGNFEEINGNTDAIRMAIISADGNSIRGVNLGGGTPGIDDGIVFAFGFAANGDVYVGGTFLDIDGTTYNRFAVYNPTDDEFEPPSGGGAPPGLDENVQGIAVAVDGTVYIGGAFTGTADALLTMNRIGTYDPFGDTFGSLVGASGNGVDDSVHEIKMDFDGITPYFCGNFTQETGAAALTLKRVALYNVAASTFDQLGPDGSEGRVRHIEFGPDAYLYAAGEFTNIGFTDAEKVAVYNRVDWLPLGQRGDGLDGGTVVRWVDVNPDGLVIFGGDFDQATGVKSGFIQSLTTWDGTRFSVIDAFMPVGTLMFTTTWNGTDLWIGGTMDDDVEIAQTIDCTNNGKARMSPVLEVAGPADLLWLENQTTAQIVQMEFEIKFGETLRLYLERGKQKAISDWRGNIIEDLLPQSDQFDLLPGVNKVAFFARFASGDSEFSLHWQDANWSFDD